jgi:hypothetical protein
VDSPAVRLLAAAAMRPYQNLLAVIPNDDGIGGAAWSLTVRASRSPRCVATAASSIGADG